MFTAAAENTYITSSYPEEITNALVQHAQDAELSIEQRTEELQEAFTDILTYLLKSAQISSNEKLVITLLENGTLTITEHSQKDTILKLLEKNPQCQRIMQRLAADALLKKGLENIKKSHIIIQEKGKSENFVFQACLKGQLSHFYLV